MLSKTIPLLFFICFSSFIFAQGNFVLGKIIDLDSKQPIPCCNISIVKSTNGTSTQLDGSFKLNFDDKDLVKAVLVSSLGYRDSIIPFGTFKQIDTLFFKKSLILLEEVILKPLKRLKEIEINKYNKLKKNYTFSCLTKPRKIALFFPYKENYKATSFLKIIKVFIKKSPLDNVRFRVRLLSNSKANSPLQDLIGENVIAVVNKKQKIVELDVSKYKIEMPLEGVHVFLEWLDFPENKADYKFKYKDLEGDKNRFKGEKIYPEFISVEDENNDLIMSYFINSGWWQPQRKSIYEVSKEKVPAISIILTD